MFSHSSKEIKTALKLDKLSLQYRIEFKPAAAAIFAAHCEEHGHTSAQLVRLIRQTSNAIPRMCFGLLNGAPNPCNGNRIHTYSIGKEHSRVVYLEVVTTYLTEFHSRPYLYTPAAIQALITKLCAIGHTVGCDEVDADVQADGFVIRYWFD